MDRFFRSMYLQLLELRFNTEESADQRFRALGWIGFWLGAISVGILSELRRAIPDIDQFWPDHSDNFRDPLNKYFFVPLVVYFISGAWLYFKFRNVPFPSQIQPRRLVLSLLLAAFLLGTVFAARDQISNYFGLLANSVLGIALARKYWSVGQSLVV